MDTLLEVGTESLLDFDSEFPCEGIHHGRGLSGHEPGAPGAYMLISPCCGPKVIQCSARVAAMRLAGVLYCSVCEHEHLTSEYDFIQL